MWGAIIGDVIGSRFEKENLYSEYFETFNNECSFTDDTVMTMATLICLQENKREDITLEVVEKYYRKIGCSYPLCGYGGMFYQWLMTYNQKAYGSYGNGALMRISPVAKWAADNNWTENEMIEVAKVFTNVTHNHQQSIEAVSLYVKIIYQIINALKNISIDKEKEKIAWEIFEKNIKNTIYEEILKSRMIRIKNSEDFDLSCKHTLQSVFSVLKETIQSDNSFTYKFEYGVKKIISLGGDTDTNAAILGAILEVIYGINPIFKYSVYKITFSEFEKPFIDALNKFYNENYPNDVIYAQKHNV